MIVFPLGIEQDTLKINQVSVQDSLRQERVIVLKPKIAQMPSAMPLQDSGVVRTGSRPQKIVKSITYADTTLVCSRSSILGVSYADPGTFLKDIELRGSDKILFSFAEKSRIRQTETREILTSHLKSGQEIPTRQLQDDWIILIIISAAFLLSFARNASRGLQSMIRFFLFRGISDSDSRDTGGIFQWHTTVLNLISFLIISLFLYQAAFYYGMIPDSMSGLAFWSASLGVIILSLTIRHVICVVIGNLSGRKDVFHEYLLGIYQSYQFGALILFILVILVSYTAVLPERVLLVSGFIVIGVMYLFRVTRLMILFMNRNISVFYLILYLCSLEILPVAIIIRYFSGTDQIG